MYVDPESIKYIQQWNKNSDDILFRVDNAREDLRSLLQTLESDPVSNGVSHALDGEPDVKMEDGMGQGENAELITIPVSAEDDLSDIPADMRDLVAGEIAAFRDASHKRDMDRLRQEEQMEAAERQRGLTGARVNRLASPPVSAPTGPAGANGVPVGPVSYTHLTLPTKRIV